MKTIVIACNELTTSILYFYKKTKQINIDFNIHICYNNLDSIKGFNIDYIIILESIDNYFEQFLLSRMKMKNPENYIKIIHDWDKPLIFKEFLPKNLFS